jgi:hypothetical protein
VAGDDDDIYDDVYDDANTAAATTAAKAAAAKPVARPVFIAEHIDGATPRDQKEAALRRLGSGETWVLSSVGVLSEGFDEPRVSCVMLLRPTASRGLYLQQLGRGLRTISATATTAAAATTTTNPASEGGGGGGGGGGEEWPSSTLSSLLDQKRDCVVLDLAGGIGRFGPIVNGPLVGSSTGNGGAENFVDWEWLDDEEQQEQEQEQEANNKNSKSNKNHKSKGSRSAAGAVGLVECPDRQSCGAIFHRRSERCPGCHRRNQRLPPAQRLSPPLQPVGVGAGAKPERQRKLTKIKKNQNQNQQQNQEPLVAVGKTRRQDGDIRRSPSPRAHPHAPRLERKAVEEKTKTDGHKGDAGQRLQQPLPR